MLEACSSADAVIIRGEECMMLIIHSLINSYLISLDIGRLVLALKAK